MPQISNLDIYFGTESSSSFIGSTAANWVDYSNLSTSQGISVNLGETNIGGIDPHSCLHWSSLRLLFDNGNIYGVYNHPSHTTTVVFENTVMIERIWTYHWNNMHGTVTPGTIALRDTSTGDIHGPWSTAGTPGMYGVPNAYWNAYPSDEILAPGTYVIVDSDPYTWAQNAETNHAGMAWIEGYDLYTDQLSNIENVRGTSYGDNIIGSAENNILQGLSGSDTLSGEIGDDTLNGGTGNDYLVGGNGTDGLLGGRGFDSLTGGLGFDAMAGGDGKDLFIFNAIEETGSTAATADRIIDFKHDEDLIKLTDIDASSALQGNNVFFFNGTGSAGTLRTGAITYHQFDFAGTTNDCTVIYLDTDADPAAEGVIRLTGLVTLTVLDFLL